MGLKLKVESQFGFPIEYWKVSFNEFDWETHSVFIKIRGYVNRDKSKEEGVKPADEMALDLVGEKFDQYFSDEALEVEGMNIRKAAYNAVKEKHLFFQTAEDVIEEVLA